MTAAPGTVRFRPVLARDADAIADLWCRRRPQEPARARERAREFLSGVGPDELVLVAEEDGVLVAYARAVRFLRPEEASPSMCPSGWYLLGIIVREDRMRRGLGRELTARRIEWLRKRGASAVHYFADFDNEASIRMHQEFGFRPIRRDVTFPRMRADSKPLVLHRLDLRPEGPSGAAPPAP